MSKHSRMRVDSLERALNKWVENLGTETEYEGWGTNDPYTSDKLYRLAAKAAWGVFEAALEGERQNPTYE